MSALISNLFHQLTKLISSVWNKVTNPIKGIFHKHSTETDNIPAAWRTRSTAQTSASTTTMPPSAPMMIPPEARIHKKYALRKMHVPILRTFKRGMAAFLIGFNFLMSQFILSAVNDVTKPIWLLFLGNAFICADYLWKTRSQDTFKKKQEPDK